MKKKIAGRLGVTALALSFITTSVMSGTLAKYTKEVTGTADATVAKFAFNLNGTAQKTDTFTIEDLFQSAYTGSDGSKIVEGSSNVVAPGTSGKKEITLENTGEVAIQLEKLDINEENDFNIPLVYAITETDVAPQKDADWKDASSLNVPNYIKTPLKVGSTENSKSFYLHWKWNTTDNSTDTGFGTKSPLDTVGITITCTVSQVVPTTTS